MDESLLKFRKEGLKVLASTAFFILNSFSAVAADPQCLEGMRASQRELARTLGLREGKLSGDTIQEAAKISCDSFSKAGARDQKNSCEASYKQSAEIAKKGFDNIYSACEKAKEAEREIASCGATPDCIKKISPVLKKAQADLLLGEKNFKSGIVELEELQKVNTQELEKLGKALKFAASTYRVTQRENGGRPLTREEITDVLRRDRFGGGNLEKRLQGLDIGKIEDLTPEVLERRASELSESLKTSRNNSASHESMFGFAKEQLNARKTAGKVETFTANNGANLTSVMGNLDSQIGKLESRAANMESLDASSSSSKSLPDGENGSNSLPSALGSEASGLLAIPRADGTNSRAKGSQRLVAQSTEDSERVSSPENSKLRDLVEARSPKESDTRQEEISLEKGFAKNETPEPSESKRDHLPKLVNLEAVEAQELHQDGKMSLPPAYSDDRQVDVLEKNFLNGLSPHQLESHRQAGDRVKIWSSDREAKIDTLVDKEIERIEKKKPLSSSLRKKLREMLIKDIGEKLDVAMANQEQQKLNQESSANVVEGIFRDIASTEEEYLSQFTLSGPETDAEIQRLLADVDPPKSSASDAILGVDSMSLFLRVKAAHKRLETRI